MIVLYVCGFVGEDSYSLSIVIEDERGVVYDLWSEYFKSGNFLDNIRSILLRAVKIFDRTPSIKDKVLNVYICDNLLDLTNDSTHLLNDLREMIMEVYGGDLKVYISTITSLDYSRGYSLAKKAYKVRGRYPPIL